MAHVILAILILGVIILLFFPLFNKLFNGSKFEELDGKIKELEDHIKEIERKLD